MRPPQARPRAGREARGFTLTELLVVIAIIGILIGFLLVAVRDGVRNAEAKATLGLITKLEVGVAERLEAMLLRRAEIVQAHYDLAQTYTRVGPIPGLQRAQVIGQFDLVKAEMPDVFFVQGAGPITGHAYPLNFAAPAYLASVDGFAYGVPLGTAYGLTVPTVPTPRSIGMFGATYQAAAGLYKNLGYLPNGYDGADNNGDGYIDDLIEGVGANPAVANPDNPATTIPLATLINTRLANHRHNTARAEMLYALLVEGTGPLGSVFSRDEFTEREVADTDGDGLPEFIDAWGEPIQFYRWPIFYNPEPGIGAKPVYVQKGIYPYNGVPEVRQVDPLDPNQTLVSLAWWLRTVNSSATAPLNSYTTANNYPPFPLHLHPEAATPSHGAVAFMTHFHPLFDLAYTSPNANGTYWDRGGSTARRAYFSRFLVLSGGPDKVPGTLSLPFANLLPLPPPMNVPVPLPITAEKLVGLENNALITNKEESYDDISNQGLASPGGGVR